MKREQTIFLHTNMVFVRATEPQDNKKQYSGGMGKQKITMTIDEKTFAAFKRFCKANAMKVSSKVELMMQEFVEQELAKEENGSTTTPQKTAPKTTPKKSTKKKDGDTV